MDSSHNATGLTGSLFCEQAIAKCDVISTGDSVIEPDGARGVEPMLTTAEVAHICRTTPSTVSYWRHKGDGPPGFRMGRRVLYPRSGVIAWLAEQADKEQDR